MSTYIWNFAGCCR